MRTGLVIVVLGLGFLVYTGRVTLPFMAPASSAAARELKNSLNRGLENSGVVRRAGSVKCSRSHALDDIRSQGHFKATYSCDVTWSDGASESLCALAIEGRSLGAGFGYTKGSCEDAAARGFGSQAPAG